MAEALKSAVVPLPTAAPARVKQPSYTKRHRAFREGVDAGRVVTLDVAFQYPWERRQDAQLAELHETYAAGSLYRNAPLLILGALLTALSPDQQEVALARLRLLHAGLNDPQSLAALTYAQSVCTSHEGAQS
jgi:predicted kinase